jgi:hypothetical protein
MMVVMIMMVMILIMMMMMDHGHHPDDNVSNDRFLRRGESVLGRLNPGPNGHHYPCQRCLVCTTRANNCSLVVRLATYVRSPRPCAPICFGIGLMSVCPSSSTQLSRAPKAPVVMRPTAPSALVAVVQQVTSVVVAGTRVIAAGPVRAKIGVVTSLVASFLALPPGADVRACTHARIVALSGTAAKAARSATSRGIAWFAEMHPSRHSSRP